MRIVQINMIHYGSTGKIMMQIAETARNRGDEVLTFSTRTYSKVKTNEPQISQGHKLFGSKFSAFLHSLLGKIFAKNGFYSRCATKRLVRKIKKYNPDIIHLHNIHNFCINLPILFNYIKRKNIKTVWTLHDCWAFTGHCAYFDMANCDKWKTGCHNCLHYTDYPKVYKDNTKWLYKKKKELFTGIRDLTIVTPSNWLARLVEQSYLKNYPVKVINNGIDLSVFKPTHSDFRQRFNLQDKFVLLGVAFGWDKRKGLDVFVELAKRLDSNVFKIVLVGVNAETATNLPDNIIAINRTNNQTELAEIYSMADLFVNPTREEVFGMVNAESLACGTPILTFKTGGSPEVIDATCGSVVEKDDIDSLEQEILRIYKKHPYTKDACITRSKLFDKNDKFSEYVNLYLELYEKNRYNDTLF